jgi:hypothetical protein
MKQRTGGASIRWKKTARFVCVSCERDLSSSELAHSGRLRDEDIGTVVWFPHCHACLAELEWSIPPAVEACLVKKRNGGRCLAAADTEGHLLPRIIVDLQ